MNFSAEKKSLQMWFLKNHDDLPWRNKDLNEKRSPYAVWISETMLQQTQVGTVKEYFLKWMKRFPCIEVLANSSETEVLKFWQGLGYYSRAKNILKTAKILMENGGKFPTERRSLEALPGIGFYTAGAILSLAFHKQESILDGNLIRIFARLYNLKILPENAEHKKIFLNYAALWASDSKAYLNNEALMELGRKICKAKNPDCNECPLKKNCQAHLQNIENELPIKKKKIQKIWEGVALRIYNENKNKVLILQNKNPSKNINPFFKNQWTVLHFELSKNAVLALPAFCEEWFKATPSVFYIKNFKHGITCHKINCAIWEISIPEKSVKKRNDLQWISTAEIHEKISNSFSLKTLL